MYAAKGSRAFAGKELTSVMRSTIGCVAVVVMGICASALRAQSSLPELRHASDRAQERIRPSSGATASDTLFELNEVDTAPEFPGGDGALRSYIAKAFHMPETDKGPLTSHIVVQFVVARNGAVTALRCSPRWYGSEAALRGMPTWLPGTKNGVPVAVNYVLPVTVCYR